MTRLPGDRLAHVALPGRLDQATLDRFAAVDTWVFDLDNTLYPANGQIWPQIDARITQFVSDYLGIDGISARALQKFYYQRFGTTLRGLSEHHDLDVGAFLDFVHDIDRTALEPNPELVDAITALPGRKLILTNGSRKHAQHTTEKLGFEQTFEAVFDIVAADLVPKPEAATYERFFAEHRVDPSRSAMFEDIARNLWVPHERGMVTVLVVPPPGDADRREPWEAEGVSDPRVDFVTDNLAGFLRALDLGRLEPRPDATAKPQGAIRS